LTHKCPLPPLRIPGLLHRLLNERASTLQPGSAIPAVKEEGILRRRCRHRPVQYLNNILEQDHRAIKRRVKAKQNFREFQAARRTIEGYETMHMIRKGQARWISGNDVRKTESVHRQVVRSACLRPRYRDHLGPISVTIFKVATLPTHLRPGQTVHLFIITRHLAFAPAVGHCADLTGTECEFT